MNESEESYEARVSSREKPLTSAVESTVRQRLIRENPLTSAVKENKEDYKSRVSSREKPLTSAVEEIDEGYRQAASNPRKTAYISGEGK